MRSLPISAPSRASSVASVSAGNARANNPNCSTRPSATSTATATRSTAAGGGFDSRSSSASVRSTRASRIGAGNSTDTARASSPSHQRQRDAQHDGAAIAALEPLAQRLEQPREHKRQRLEAVDRPFEIERCLELLRDAGRHERPHLFAARPSLPAQAVLTEACGELGRRQRTPDRQGAQAPPSELLDARALGFGLRLWAQLASGPESAAQSPKPSCVSILSGSGASAAASSPRGTTVNPARACASRMAAVDVAATAMCTRSPASAAVRRSSSPIARGSPMRLPSPLMSSVTVRSPCVSTRGEKSRAIWHEGRVGRRGVRGSQRLNFCPPPACPLP